MAQSNAFYYHYTNRKAAWNIYRDRRLNISRNPIDIKAGQGLYLTCLTPDHHTDEELLHNNYGNKPIGKDKSDVECYFKIPKMEICEKLEAVPPHNRSLFRVPEKGIDLSGMAYAIGSRADDSLIWEIDGKLITEEWFQKMIPESRTQEEKGVKAGDADMPALGRPFELGMLYNCRTDKLTDGRLWESDQIQDWIIRKNESENETRECLSIVGDSIDAKFDVFGIKSNLKMSILSGLVSPSQGASGYLWHRSPSNKKATVSFLCRKAKRYEGLKIGSVGEVSDKNRHIAFDTDATHVVTGIMHGSEGVYTFERAMNDSKSRGQEERDLVNKTEHVFGVDLKSLDDTVALDWKYFGEEPHVAQKSTLRDAASHYQEMTRDTKEPIPIKVWLTPLGSMRMSEVSKISHENEVATQSILEDLDSNKADCYDLLQSDVCKYSQQLGKKITELSQLLDTFRMQFREDLVKLLPQIRGNSIKVEELDEVIDQVKRSPFITGRWLGEMKDVIHQFPASTYGVQAWLEHKKQTVLKLETYLAKMGDIPFRHMEVCKGPHGNMIYLRADHIDEHGGEDAHSNEKDCSDNDGVNQPSVLVGECKGPLMCFRFYEEVLEDSFLGTLQEFLRNRSNGNGGSETNGLGVDRGVDEINNEPNNYDDTEERIDRFLEFYAHNKKSGLRFFATFSDVGCGSTISYYKDGELVLDQFDPPSAAGAPRETTPKTVSLQWEEPVCGGAFVKGYQVERRYGDTNWVEEEESVRNQTSLEVTETRNYRFRVRALTRDGYVGPYSEVSEPIHTLQSASETNRLAAEHEETLATNKKLKEEIKTLKATLEGELSQKKAHVEQ